MLTLFPDLHPTVLSFLEIALIRGRPQEEQNEFFHFIRNNFMQSLYFYNSVVETVA